MKNTGSVKNLIQGNYRYFCRVFFILLIISLCVAHSLQAGHFADYIPTNGTFQNFNPVRRLLSGQIPYRDFIDYLGLGHLFSGTIATAFLGGSYTDSLRAFSFLSIFSFAMILFVLGQVIFGSYRKAEVVTLALLCMILISPIIGENTIALPEEIKTAIEEAVLIPGNSARMIRGMIVPIVCMIVLLCQKMLTGAIVYQKNRSIIKCTGMGALAGGALIWSNDYGISTAVCLMVLFLWGLICRRNRIGRILKKILLFIIGAVSSCFLLLECFTWGNAINWFESTFGTGSFQSWYYNGSKTFFLYQADLTFMLLLQACICMVYLLMLFRCKADGGSIIRYGIPALFNMTGFCAANEYKILSGGASREVAYIILFVTIFCEVLACLSRYLTGKNVWNKIEIAVLTLALALNAYIFKEELIFYRWTEEKGVYIAELEGYNTYPGGNLYDTAEFLDGGKVFATYASGIETVTDQFQPSGTDYIIHVLGDKARERYLECFLDSDFQYAATLKPSFSSWETWAERANWFFYRELYSQYVPVYSNTYEVFWEKTDQPDVVTDNIRIEVEDGDSGSKLIHVYADEGVNGVADVFIDYKTDTVYSSPLVIQKMVQVESSCIDNNFEESYYESNYLRESSSEYIPIRVINGYGEVTIKSLPKTYTKISLEKIECRTIYTAPFAYAMITNSTDMGKNIKLGIDHDVRNRVKFENAKAVDLDGNVFPILEMNFENGQSYIVVQSSHETDDEAMNRLLRQENQCLIIKER